MKNKETRPAGKFVLGRQSQEEKVDGDLETEAGSQAPQSSRLSPLFSHLANTAVLAPTLGITEKGGRRGVLSFPKAATAKDYRPVSSITEISFSHFWRLAA